ncbi:MAG: DUF58 domain-containing protein [Planctomycetes bacterium]|nr:DUF58 domain-containing protein [Planctomycetota bacterium]
MAALRGLELFPAVHLAPGFALRAAAFARAVGRRAAAFETAGRARALAAGDDLHGLRAYRAGDDPRAIDWTASARAEAPLVRVLRAARGGRTAIVLDASLSMAVGPPGKLQAAAEAALALACVAARAGARVELVVLPQGDRHALARVEQFPGLVARLAGLAARGALTPGRGTVPRCDRAVWIGDLAGLSAEELARAAPRGAAFAVLQVLAPHELAPRLAGPAVLVDPESGASLVAGPDDVPRHAAALERQRVSLARALSRRRARFARAASDEPFETACTRLLGP